MHVKYDVTKILVKTSGWKRDVIVDERNAIADNQGIEECQQPVQICLDGAPCFVHFITFIVVWPGKFTCVGAAANEEFSRS